MNNLAFFRSVDVLLDRYTELLQELIRTPSPIGDEAEAQKIMVREMKRIGLEVSIIPNSCHFNERISVVGNLKGTSRKNFVLNAHMDTVPIGDPSKWTFSPLGGCISNGKMYGRGACDDKSGCVEMLWLSEALKKAGISLSVNLVLQSVVGDEAEGDGTEKCLALVPYAEAAIILDGTWSNRIVAAHHGALGFRVVFAGCASSAFSIKQENPLFPASAFVNHLKDALKKKDIALHIGKIIGGDWFSSSPSACIVEGLCSFPRSVKVEEVKEMLAHHIEELEEDFPFLRTNPPLLNIVGPCTNAISAECNWALAKELQSLIAKLFKTKTKLHTLTGFSDMRHFADHSIPCCLFGPGQGGNAHAVDEYIVLEDMLQVTKIIGAFLLSRYAG